MGTPSPLAPAWAAKRTAMYGRKVEQALQHFHRRYRQQVIQTARQHPALADLALSFPALLFRLAVHHRETDAGMLKNLVTAGAPLKSIALQARLPLWTRKLPPQALAQPHHHLPQDPVCARQIVNHLPRRSKHAARWLRNVQLACECADEPFAVWAAREWNMDPNHGPWLRRQALWAWFSVRPQLEGHQFVTRPWTPHMKRRSAHDACTEFFARLKLHVTIADAAIAPLWIETRAMDGFEFVPLLSASDIHEEARAMQNCVRTYGMDIAASQQRLWSMRRNGKRHATLSVGNNYDLGLITITEIKGPGNSKVPREVALAAHRWFRTIDPADITVAERDFG